MELPDQEALPARIGAHFEAREVLGAGGMGVVYRAVDLRTDTPTALKVLLPKHGDRRDLARRFGREVRAIQRLSHRNIVQILDSGEDPARKAPFLAMELVDGPSLSERLRDGPFSNEEVIALAAGTANGLAAAHELGIVHRDVKPGNILLGGAADNPESYRVCDFGLAKILDELGSAEPTTIEGSVLGTPAYMAPEQARGLPVDHRADIYAFGVVLFQACAGRRPFEADSPLGFLMMHATEAPPRLSELRPDAAPEVCELVHRCLAKAPEDRPQSMKVILQSLGPTGTEATWPSEPRSPQDGAFVPRSRPTTSRGLPGAALGLASASVLVGAGLMVSDAKPSGTLAPAPLRREVPALFAARRLRKPVIVPSASAPIRRNSEADIDRSRRRAAPAPAARVRTRPAADSTPLPDAAAPPRPEAPTKTELRPRKAEPARAVAPAAAAPPRPLGPLQVSDIHAEGGLSLMRIEVQLQRKLRALEKCLDSTSPSEIRVTGVLGFSGRLSRVDFSPPLDATARECATSVLVGVRFPRPDTGGAALRFRMGRGSER